MSSGQSSYRNELADLGATATATASASARESERERERLKRTRVNFTLRRATTMEVLLQTSPASEPTPDKRDLPHLVACYLSKQAENRYSTSRSIIGISEK